MPQPVREASDFDGAFATMAQARPDGLVMVANPFTSRYRARILEFAAKQRLPAMHELRGWVVNGGLMAYGPSEPDMWRRAATYVDKVLRGARPADLPVEEPTKYDMIINLRTAKALGLTIPQSVIMRADEVIE